MSRNMAYKYVRNVFLPIMKQTKYVPNIKIFSPTVEQSNKIKYIVGGSCCALTLICCYNAKDIISHYKYNLDYAETKKYHDMCKFIIAARNNDIETMKILLKDGMNINKTNEYGNTALIIAAANGSLESVKFLITEGAKINIINDLKITALIAAATKNHTDVVDYLLKNGGNADEINNKDFILSVASSNGDLKTVQTSLQNGANINYIDYYGNTALMNAVKKNDIDIIHYLVNKKADINIKSSIDGTTALMYAVQGHCDTDIIRYLIHNGANINIANMYGNTALHYAGSSRAIQVLNENGADENAKNNYGYSPAVYRSCDRIKHDVSHTYKY